MHALNAVNFVTSLGSLVVAVSAVVVALFRRGKQEGIQTEIMSNTQKILTDHEMRIRELEAGRKLP